MSNETKATAYVLVPVEPTEEILSAIFRHERDARRAWAEALAAAPAAAPAASPVAEVAAAVQPQPITCQTFGQGIAVPCGECNQTLVDVQELEELRRLAAAVQAEPADGKPLASMLKAADGTVYDFQPRVREFFGAIIDDDAYVHDDEDIAKADHENPGLAPHRQVFVYERAASQPQAAEAVPLSDGEWARAICVYAGWRVEPDGIHTDTADVSAEDLRTIVQAVLFVSKDRGINTKG